MPSVARLAEVPATRTELAAATPVRSATSEDTLPTNAPGNEPKVGASAAEAGVAEAVVAVTAADDEEWQDRQLVAAAHVLAGSTSRMSPATHASNQDTWPRTALSARAITTPRAAAKAGAAAVEEEDSGATAIAAASPATMLATAPAAAPVRLGLGRALASRTMAARTPARTPRLGASATTAASRVTSPRTVQAAVKAAAPAEVE